MHQKNEVSVSEFFTGFFVITGCVCILMGTLGSILYPDVPLSYGAFFSPPLFGLLTNLPSLFLQKSRFKNTLFLFHLFNLIIIEGIVIGLNVMFGNHIQFDLTLISIIVGIAITYCSVSFILWYNEKNMAKQFNAQLRLWQEHLGGNVENESE